MSQWRFRTPGLLLDYIIGRFFKMLQTQACYQQVDKSIPFRSLQIPSDPFRSLQIPWATEVDLSAVSAVSAVARCRWCCPSSPHFPSRAASPRRLHEFSGDIVKWSWDSISWPSLEVSSFVARSAFGIFWHLLASFGIFWRLSDSFGVSFGIFFWVLNSGVLPRAESVQGMGFFFFNLGNKSMSPALGHFGHFGHLRWSVETLLKAAELELWKSVEVARVRWDLTVSYCIGQSAPLVGILWGTFFFKELGGNPLGHNLEQRGYPQIVLYSHVSSSLSLL